jgi:hypothetical protein
VSNEIGLLLTADHNRDSLFVLGQDLLNLVRILGVIPQGSTYLLRRESGQQLAGNLLGTVVGLGIADDSVGVDRGTIDTGALVSWSLVSFQIGIAFQVQVLSEPVLGQCVQGLATALSLAFRNCIHVL